MVSTYIYLTLNLPKTDDIVFVCKFSKNVKSMLYHIENSKTREQTVMQFANSAVFVSGLRVKVVLLQYVVQGEINKSR